MGSLWLNGINYSGGGADVEITGEASGAIASFRDGSNNPLVKLETDINPVQDLHGYDKPWTAGAGKNKLPYTEKTQTINGATFTINSDGTVSTSGTPTASAFFIYETPTLPAGDYKFFSGADNDKFSPYVYNATQRRRANNGETFNVAVGDSITVYLQGKADQNLNGQKVTMMICLSTETDATFAPYTNICPISGRSSVEVTVADDTTDPTTEETYEIALGQTVYGGKLNVTTGELTVDRYLYSFTGNESFISNPSAWGNYAFLYNAGVNLKSSFSTLSYCKSSHLDAINAGGWGYLTPNTFMIEGTTFMGIGFDGTVAELKAWLASQNTADTPVQIMGVLETPTTIELTPTEVDSLLGNNNIWADCGDSDVVYIRDIDKAFNILWNAVMNSNSGTRSLNLMKGAISETKEDIEEPIKEEEETKEGNDENQR